MINHFPLKRVIKKEKHLERYQVDRDHCTIPSHPEPLHPIVPRANRVPSKDHARQTTWPYRLQIRLRMSFAHLGNHFWRVAEFIILDPYT